MLLLDRELTVLAASMTFRDLFVTSATEAEGVNLYDLHGGKWNTPAVRRAVMRSLSGAELEARGEMDFILDAAETRRIQVIARKLSATPDPGAPLLLTVTDVTDARAQQRERATLRREKSSLIQALSRQSALRDALCERLGISIDCTDGRLLLRVLFNDEGDADASPDLALIVADMVTEALIHAYPDRFPSRVEVARHPTEAAWSLRIRDPSDNTSVSSRTNMEGGFAETATRRAGMA
jgi:hypothetical protein